MYDMEMSSNKLFVDLSKNHTSCSVRCGQLGAALKSKCGKKKFKLISRNTRQKKKDQFRHFLLLKQI